MFICEKGLHSVQELLTSGKSKRMLHLQPESLSQKWGALQRILILRECKEAHFYDKRAPKSRQVRYNGRSTFNRSDHLGSWE